MIALDDYTREHRGVQDPFRDIYTDTVLSKCMDKKLHAYTKTGQVHTYYAPANRTA